jgi:uncharacterized Zn finger protein
MVGYILGWEMVSPSVYKGEIRGSIKYQLKIDCENESLFCSCPHFAKGFVCKHLVGGILPLKARQRIELIELVKKIR